MNAPRPSLDEDARTAVRLLTLMKREEPETARLKAIISVAVVRLCALHPSDEVAAFLRGLAGRLPPQHREDFDGAPRRPLTERLS